MKLSPPYIALLRIATGVVFFSIGLAKLREGWFTSPDALISSLHDFQTNASGVQLWYLTNIAVPYAGIWSKLIATGEFVIGISLLVGLLTRFSAAVAIFMLVNLHLASGLLMSLRFFESSSGILLMAVSLVLMLARAGRWLGVDAMLAKSDANGNLW